MKKTYFGAIFASIVLVTSFVCYGCKKDEESNSVVETKGSISGVIYDYTTEVPVPQALVSLTPSGAQVLSDDDGKFEIKDLEPERYIIMVSKSGYQGDRVITSVEAGKNSLVHIFLARSE